ncbi:MAG: ATP-binding protein, partial [Phormidesmis sp.]
MVDLPDGRAKTLRDAFRLCDVGPLESDEAIARYYVDLSTVRSSVAIRSIKTKLDFSAPGQFDSLLFTGHRGCGKSTELQRLKKEWDKPYRVIYVETDNEIDSQDADYTDLYLVIIKQVADDLAKLRLGFDPALLTAFEDWFKDVTNETEESVEKSISLTTTAEGGIEIPFISKLAAKLLAQIKGSNVQKRKIRDTLRQDIGRLKGDMNRLLQNAFEQVQQAGYEKGYLIIFDNLDRVPTEVGDRLYFDYATQLRDLNCTLIYTVPISVVYSDKNLSNAFGTPNVMPMVSIYQFDTLGALHLEHNLDAIKKLARLIITRVDHKTVFANDRLVAELVKASGGHARQLMQMTATACLTAASNGHAQVEAADVKSAIQQERINFKRVIPHRHYPLLVATCKTKQIIQNEDGQKMLFNTSVLEYESDDHSWHYVN